MVSLFRCELIKHSRHSLANSGKEHVLNTYKIFRYLLPALTFFLSVSAKADALSSYRCSEIQGAKIIAEDGTYLGTLDDHYQSDSIFSPYNDYGSTYSQESIWNEHSNHGNQYSQQSPFNEYASDSPVLLKDGEVVGRLTVREYEIDRIDPRTVGKDCDWHTR